MCMKSDGRRRCAVFVKILKQIRQAIQYELPPGYLVMARPAPSARSSTKRLVSRRAHARREQSRRDADTQDLTFFELHTFRDSAKMRTSLQNIRTRDGLSGWAGYGIDEEFLSNATRGNR